MREPREEKLFEFLEGLYRKFNKREYIHSDPVGFLYRYDNVRDREVAALIASSLAYGRVAQINRSVSRVLAIFGANPSSFVVNVHEKEIREMFSGFVHRFTTGEDVFLTILGMRRAIEKYGSLEICFMKGLGKSGGELFPGLVSFCREINAPFCGKKNSLIPRVENKSSLKRLHLFLRWMARRDEVDPGGWDRIDPRELVIPLDVHIHRISSAFGFTSRKQADYRTAREVTLGFKKFSPSDPVKYDFVLARMGILGEFDESFLINDKV